MMYGPDPGNLIMMTVVVLATSTARHSQNWTPDFSKILTRGVKGIREEAQTKLTALSEPRDIVYKKPFLEAVIITCDAMTFWSRRYAKLAAELAAKEKDLKRKKELREIDRRLKYLARRRPELWSPRPMWSHATGSWRSATDKIDQGDLSEKPGWVRMSIHPTMTNSEIYLITNAIKEIVENIDKWQNDYNYDIHKNEFFHISADGLEKERIKSWFDLSQKESVEID